MANLPKSTKMTSDRQDVVRDNRMQVWFKSDLRVDDHPGLHLASKAARVLPVFCFDPKLHTHLLRTPNGLEGKHTALLPLPAKFTPGISQVPSA